MMIKLKDLNFPVLIGGFLGIAALITLNIIVINAEFLVAMCFVLFIIFAYNNFSHVIINMLEDRTNKIQKDFGYYFELQEDVLTSLIAYHEKRSKLPEEIKQISNFSKNEVEKILDKRQKVLNQIILQQLEQKLKIISLKEISITQMIQEETSYWFSKSVYSEFQANKTSNFYKDILFQEGIDTINRMSTFTTKNIVSDNNILNQLVLIKNHLSVPMNVLIIGALGKL